MEIIGRLPMRQRQVVDLRLCGYKYNDIAEELGTSVGNVKNSMFLARKNLKRMLGE
jgi:DNA-directed RNA polymerase specialized sigma24 family protein